MKCPECRKEIQKAAVKCEHCDAWLDDRWVVGQYNVLVMKERNRRKHKKRLLLYWAITLLFATITLYCERTLSRASGITKDAFPPLIANPMDLDSSSRQGK